MCGRFVRRTPGKDIAKEFDVDGKLVPLFRPSFNVAPTDEVLAVIRDPAYDEDAPVDADDERRHHNAALWMHWGLVPATAKDASRAASLINARRESFETNGLFKMALEHRRCLVVADGFIEWEKDGKKKYPHLFERADGGPFGMAGIWSRWTKPDGEVLVSCSIITAPANPLVERFHDRMPVILPRESYTAWLDVETFTPSLVTHLLEPLPADAMREHEVSTRVNAVAHNDEACLEPVTKKRRKLFD